MITPRFQIKQTESDLVFTIHAPYASIADAEIYADLDTFCFYASPYYLRLHLSGHIEETDASKGSYDADTGTFVICVQKSTKGEHFKDLDFVTALLTPSQQQKRYEAKPLVEVIGQGSECSENATCASSDEDEEEWYIDQCPFEEPSQEFLLAAPHYGFGNKISGAFQNFKTEFLEVIDLPDPDGTPVSERTRLRKDRESEDFSDDHYLADWAQPDLIEPLLEYEPCWEKTSEATFLDEEVDILKDLPKKEFLLEKKELQLVCFSLVDILFAHAYNARTTMGENTVESSWTVNKLSGTLCWLQNFSTLKEACSVPVRRSLCYPLYRHWGLSIKVLDDVKNIIKLGRRQILKCLLEMYVLFNNSEPRYLLNQLYIRDYLIWIQQVSETQIKSLSDALDKVSLRKCDVDLELEELETAAEIVKMEEEAAERKSKQRKNKSSTKATSQEQNLCKDVAALSISKKCDKETSPTTSDSEDDSSDSEEDSSDSEEDSSETSSSEEDSSDLDSDDLSDAEIK